MNAILGISPVKVEFETTSTGISLLLSLALESKPLARKEGGVEGILANSQSVWHLVPLATLLIRIEESLCHQMNLEFGGLSELARML